MGQPILNYPAFHFLHCACDPSALIASPPQVSFPKSRRRSRTFPRRVTDPRCDMAGWEASNSEPTCHKRALLLPIGKTEPNCCLLR